MYEGIADEKNRMFVLSSSNPNKRKTVQTGAIEEYIFCNICDNEILSSYERYAANHFYNLDFRGENVNFRQIVNEHGIGLIQCENIDYANFKIFLLSLLWRASITTNPLFQNFKLPQAIEEELRIAILNNDPLTELEFPCLLFTHQNNEQVATDLVFVKAIQDDKAIFYINQFIYTFYLNKMTIDPIIHITALNKQGRMAVVKAPHGTWTKIRKSVFAGLAEVGNKKI
ncbi:MAG: hypothetical protein O9294_11870 [Cytophagales bacterium]|nr:hypothetical protein [Cytophagales bacterium]